MSFCHALETSEQNWKPINSTWGTRVESEASLSKSHIWGTLQTYQSNSAVKLGPVQKLLHNVTLRLIRIADT